MIKAIIFDMDGTVLNTIDDIMVAVNHALSIKDLPLKTLEEVKLAVGNGAFKLIERVTPKSYTLEERKVLFHLYQDYYDAHSSIYTKPYEGIIDLIKELKKRNLKLGVVSNKFEHLVQGLNQDFFFGLFDVVVGEVKGIPIKPAPDMIYKALDLLNVSKEETLFVGDSEVDIDTAANAYVKSVGVTWGFRKKEVLTEHNADYIIEEPNELLSVIDKENTR